MILPPSSIGKKPRRKGNSEKMPNDMSLLITLPPKQVAALSPVEVQQLIEEKVAKAIQATEQKQLSLPSPSENLQSPQSQDIINTKATTVRMPCKE
ncbi:hypothetical protein CDL15_Pgr027259 [Punica granatum]|uniref:Uncharacterized protein n=1 Tax=Punica granatum TaxID=22663 RepID=A0A218XM57_PUNGR|nr:hypothetical protein CDL15_Pgr027259 [Punica granatum]